MRSFRCGKRRGFIDDGRRSCLDDDRLRTFLMVGDKIAFMLGGTSMKIGADSVIGGVGEAGETDVAFLIA